MDLVKIRDRIKIIPYFPHEKNNKESLFLLSLFLAALVFRLAYLWQIKDYPFMLYPSIQPQYFLGKAYAIARGDLTAGGEPFFYAPLYYYFLALIMRVSSYSFTLFNTFVVQCVIGSFNCLLHYLLARELFNRRIAVIAALMAFFYAPYIFFDCDPVSATIVIFLNSLALLLLLRFSKKGEYKNLLAAGFLMGLSILARPNMLLVAGFLTLWIFFLRKYSFTKRIQGAFLFALVICLCILPVTVSNYIKCKEFILISTNGPINFYIGNNQHAVGYFAIPPDMPWLNSQKMHNLTTELAPALNKSKLKYREANAYLMKKTWQDIRMSPLRTLRLIMVKLYFTFYKFEMPNPDYYYFRFVLTPFLRIFFLSFAIITPLGLAGIIFSKGSPGIGLFKLFFFGYLITLLVTFVSQRYRLPLVPILIVFAAFFVNYLMEVLKRRQFWKILTTVSVVLLFYIAVNCSDSFLRKHFNLKIRTPEWDVANGFRRLATRYELMKDKEGFEHSMGMYKKFLHEDEEKRTED